MTSSERILKVAEENGGTITTEQVNRMKIHRTTLRTMVDKRVFSQISLHYTCWALPTEHRLDLI